MILLVFLVMITYIPQISLWLPNTLIILRVLIRLTRQAWGRGVFDA